MLSVQGSAVAIGGRGVLIIGAPGSGKSDLALRLLDRGAQLIADDLVDVADRAGRLVAQPVVPADERIDVAQLGVIGWPQQAVTPLALAVPLALVIALEASPTRALRLGRYGPLFGRYLPQLTLDPGPASAPVKVELALDRWGL